jgi:hypothetical protein
VTVGLSQIEQYGERLYFVSQAGFFSADMDFSSARFISGDGPESYEKFSIANGIVYFRKSGVTGKGGIYAMNLDGTGQRRLVDGGTGDFAAGDGYVFYIDAELRVCRADALTGEQSRVGSWTADRICMSGSGAIIRNTGDGFSLYQIQPDSGEGEKVSEAGVGGFQPLGGGKAVCAMWDGNGIRYALAELPAG